MAQRIAISQWRKLRNRLVAQRRAHDETPRPGLGPDHVAMVAALRQLPARQRQPIVLHHVADRSVADIAEELDVAPGTVKAWLSRGRTAMREHLQEDAR